MINKRFEEAIKDAVGEEQYINLRKHKSYRIAMQFFDESVKPKFNPYDQDRDEVYYVNFPMAGPTLLMVETVQSEGPTSPF